MKVGAENSGWTVAIPVKDPHNAKSRLEDSPHGRRRVLAAAFLADVLTVVGQVPTVGRVIVLPGGENLNAELRAGLVGVVGPVAVLVGDLPALTAAGLAATLHRCAAPAFAIVADRSGRGTVLLTASGAAHLDPCFGVGSAAAHQQRGALPIPAADAGLACDVDTEQDLDHATLLGVGPFTAAALGALTQRGCDESDAPGHP